MTVSHELFCWGHVFIWLFKILIKTTCKVNYYETDTSLVENTTEQGERAKNIQGLPKRVIEHFTEAWLEYILHK